MENTEIQITLEQGEGYFESGDIEAAKRCFKKILSSQPDHIESLNNLGVIYFQEGNLEPAIFSFEGVLKIDETYVEAMENLAKCLEVKGDYLESAKLYQKALKLGGLKVYILNSMANCFIQMEDLATAKQILTESSAIDNTQNDIETLLELIKSIECAQKTKPTHLTSNKGLRIGFVTLWYERGQAYITRMLQDSIVEEHETFILARNGGSSQLPLLATTGEWAVPNLTTFHEYKIPCDMLKNWIQKYQLDIVIFNEEYDFTLVREAKKCGAKTFGYYVWELFNPEWSKTVRAIYDKVICPTSCSHQRFIKLGIDNSVYLKWGVDRNLFHPVEKVIKKPIRFFHPAGWGGLHARRGTQYVIDAFRKAHIEDAELLIHTQQGKGKEQEGNITILHGTVPREELVQMYQESDVAVLPSKWEGLGLTFLEAISCGLPILTVDAPPMNEFVKNRETGFLCGITERCHYSDIFIEGVHVDTDDMAEKMHMMMDNTLRREMTEKTKAFASCFTRDQFKENLQNLLRDTIKQPHNEVRLNLGCGSDIRDGFVNIDRRKIDGVDLITDVSNLPYHDESVREIVAHDIIEHFPRGETEKVLTEWTRVLKQNGILKIQCPNVRDLSYALVSHQIPVKEFARRIYGGQEYDGNFHHTGFDIPEMKRVLHAIGMKPTQISAYNYNLFINAIRSTKNNGSKLRVILISARFSNHPWGTGNFIYKALNELGHEVIDIDFRRDCDRVDELLNQPADLVITYKGSGINPRLLEMTSCPTILWYPDDVRMMQHAQDDIRRSGYAYDHVYYFDQAGLPLLDQMGISHSSFLPPATDPSVYRYIPGTEKKHDVTFIGNVYPNRRELLDRLKKNFNVLETKAFMEDMVRIVNETKIVLNLGVGKSGYTLRVFEALGCRSFLVTNKIDYEYRLFKDQEHLVYFDDDNIEDIISHYLQHDEERERIALTGYQEVCAHHTFHNRVSKILVDTGLTEHTSTHSLKGRHDTLHLLRA